MRKTAWIAIGVVAVLGVGWIWWAASTGRPVVVATVKRQAIREFLVERGKTRLPETHLITMPLGGRLEAVTLREGDRVRKGQVVARMVPLDLQLDVEEAAAVVARLDAAIRENAERNVEQTALAQAKRFVESMDETVKAAAARVESGKAAYEYAQKHYERVEPLVATGARAAEDLDRATLERVQSRVNYKQDQLVHSAMRAMAAATNLMPTMIEQYMDNKGLAEAVLVKQKAEAAARLRQIEQDQRRGTMTSPVDGVVLSRFVFDEQFLPAGTKLLEIGRLEDLEVEAAVLSLDVVEVEPGDPVEIFGPAVGEPAARGTVKTVYPAGFTKISSLGVEQQRVKVIIQINPEDLVRLLEERHVEVGYRVRVRIITDQKPDALVIPRTALFRGSDNRWGVYVVRNGRVELVDVETGLGNDQEVEIIRGLNEGDLVIPAPENDLSPGQSVTCEP